MTWTYAGFFVLDVISSPILWFGLGLGLVVGVAAGHVHALADLRRMQRDLEVERGRVSLARIPTDAASNGLIEVRRVELVLQDLSDLVHGQTVDREHVLIRLRTEGWEGTIAVLADVMYRAGQVLDQVRSGDATRTDEP